MKKLLIILCILLTACGTTNNYYTEEEDSIEFMYGQYKNEGNINDCSALEPAIRVLPTTNGLRVIIQNYHLDLVCEENICKDKDYEFDMHEEGFIIITKDLCKTLYVHDSIK